MASNGKNNHMRKKPTTQRLMDHINETIGKQFDTQALVEDTNEISRKAAVDLWRPLEGR